MAASTFSFRCTTLLASATPLRATTRARVSPASSRQTPLRSSFAVTKTALSSSNLLRTKAVESAQENATEAPDHPITISETALTHVVKLREESEGENLCLRIGVKQGGCSGLSYHMDFESETNVSSDDMVMEYGEEGFKLVCDPKSLLYLFGMRLDYSNELIGGGFQFQNPNAENSCGCGKSFAA